MAEHAHPPMTTVHQPIYKIGSMVCEMLLRILLGEDLEQEQVILKPSLVVRQSCGARLTEAGAAGADLHQEVFYR